MGEVICVQIGWSALIFRNFAWGKPSLSEICETSLTIRRISDRVSISANSSAINDARERFYFKGESDNRVWVSPHDETPNDPCDAAPEELDVATAIDRFESVVDWPVERVERSWAGLRSFSPDRVPVFGFDSAPGFFWCVGQGGFGIQTSPAAAKLCASLLLGQDPEPLLAHIGPALFRASRFG